jgi:phosphoribosylanthranilate isomerase
MVRIKICGLKTPEDITAVNTALPDYIGFVFTENSRRYISPETAKKLSAALDPGIIPVGVFVNAETALITELYRDGVIKIAQLHGGESFKEIETLKTSGVPVIQAIRFGRGDTLCPLADYYLFDGASGGSGKSFDWSSVPDTDKPVFLAGGINTDNISAALDTRPYAIDVSSGAESGVGKDSAKIAALVRKVRETV